MDTEKFLLIMMEGAIQAGEIERAQVAATVAKNLGYDWLEIFQKAYANALKKLMIVAQKVPEADKLALKTKIVHVIDIAPSEEKGRAEKWFVEIAKGFLAELASRKQNEND